MAFIRKHRVSKGARERSARPLDQAQRFMRPGEGLVVFDTDGTEVLRTGTYGTDLGDETNRGLVFRDTTGASTAEMNTSQVSMGNPIVGSVQSDAIVQIAGGTQQIFLDFTNGDDVANDGKAPSAYSEGFLGSAGTAWDARVADDGIHKWNLLQGTTANITAGAGNGKMVMAASDAADMSAQMGGMFDEASVSVQADKVPATGVLNFILWFRMYNKGSWSTNGQGYRVRLQVAAAGGVPTLAVLETVDGTATTIVGPTALADAANFVVNVNWNIRAQCYYNYATQTTTIRAKAWKSTGSEPAAWTVTVNSTNDALLQRGGSMGLGSSTGAITNPNITCLYSSFSYKLLDPDLIASDDTSATAGALDYTVTAHGPYQTLSRAMRDVSEYNAAKVFINWHNGNQTPIEPNTHIDGIVGPGELYLFSSGPTITGGLSFNGNSSFIHLQGLTITDSGGGQGADAFATILVNTSRHVEIFDVRIQSNQATSGVTDNIRFIQGAEGSVYRCQLNTSSAACVRAMEGSVVKVNANAGAGGTNSYIAQASIIFMSGQAPTGGTTTTTSGQIFNAGAAPAPASTGGGTGGPTSSKVTKTWNANGSGTYGMQYGTWAAGDVVQGAYGGSQNHKGLYHYPASVQSTITGKTINAGYITLRRESGGGSSSAQNIYLAVFDTNSVTSGDPGSPVGGTIQNLGALAWGQTKTFKVSNTLLGYLQTAVSGGTRCIGVFQSDGSPYVILNGTNTFSGAGKLKITYT